MKIHNKTILITGGAVRIGRALTLEMVKCGAHVFCQYNSSKKQAQSLLHETEKFPGKLNLIRADFTKLENALNMLETVRSQQEHIDILINNAAVFFKTPIGEINETDWDRQFTINLKIPFFLSQKIGLLMTKKGSGKIINIGDTSGLNPWPGYLPYSLTKSGIIAMTKGLAKALAPKVLVNCINPGPVLIPEYYTESEIQNAIDKTLLKRSGTADDIVQTAKYLIEGSDYVTGSIINVDGGRNIK